MKPLSSSEMVRGCTPSLVQIPQSKVPLRSWPLTRSNQANVRCGNLTRVEIQIQYDRKNSTVETKSDKVHYFKRATKFGNCEPGYVRVVEDHILTLSTNKQEHGEKIRAAYEDSRTFPESTLFQDLQNLSLTKVSL